MQSSLPDTQLTQGQRVVFTDGGPVAGIPMANSES